MAEIHHLPDASRVESEASDWIARLQSDDVDESERARFQQWLEAHPSHSRIYEELLGTWKRFERAGSLVSTVTAGHALGNVHHVARRRAWLPVAAAAVLALVTVGSWWGWNELRPRGSSMQTAIGQQATVSLPDGSKVDLNTSTQMRVDYRSDARVIELARGEAHFEVAHDAERPFWVVADGTWIRAVGTAFDVYLGPTSLEVTVTEGKVQVAAGRSAPARRPSDTALVHMAHSLLSAGQKFEYNGEGAQVRAATVTELRRSQSWRTGTLHFENQTLGEILQELGRYTTTQLIVEDATLRDMRLGGAFKASEEGAQALLTMLEQNWDVELIRESPDRVRLTRSRD